MWECTPETLTQLDDGFWSFPIQQMGIYSVVINPRSSADSSGTNGSGDSESFFEKTLTWIIISAILLVIIICVLLIYFLCCRGKQRGDPLATLPPAVIPAQANERERLLPGELDGEDAQSTQQDERHEMETRLMQERFDQLMTVKQEEVEKLEYQLSSLKNEHDQRQ